MNGFWGRYDEQIENPYFPFELHYENDSLYMVDGFLFTHQASFLVEDDTLILTFSNGSKLKVNFSIESDSIHIFGKGKFFKMFPEEFTSVPHYNLIGYKTDEILKKSNLIAGNVHLIKINDSAKVILNDITTDLKYISDFFDREHDSRPSAVLYVGEGIEFRDLLRAYKWVRVAGVSQVTLVTDNNAFDEFYIEKDYISIDDSLMEELFEEEGMHRFPPAPKTRNTASKILTIKDSTDFEKLNTIEDSTEYLIQVDHQISILDYLELNKRIKDKYNIEKEIKRLTIE